MNNCVFCQIVEGKASCHKVYEDENYFAFLDNRPLSPGNVLLISKKHYRFVYDVPDFGGYWETAKKVGKAVQSTMNAESINFLTIGEEVPHAHIRIIPRYGNDLPFQLFPKHIPDNEMKAIAERIKSTL
jgi:histidine triad (HIT) family protein